MQGLIIVVTPGYFWYEQPPVTAQSQCATRPSPILVIPAYLLGYQNNKENDGANARFVKAV